jgi:hypothetical protein
MGPVKQAQWAAMRKILRPDEVQAKPDIGENGGKYEQEPGRLLADFPVSAISGTPPGGPGGEPLLQRAKSEEPEEELQRQPEEEEEEPIQAKLIQRPPDNEEEEELQAKSKPGETPTVTPSLESHINSLKGGGKPLDSATRAFFEPSFGHDFSPIRIHADSNAAETAKLVNARAFTLGGNMVFGSGEYQPQSREGRRLLGHELTHVVQQGVVRPASAADRPRRIQPSLQPDTIQRWNLGTAPAPAGWDVITDPLHLRRYNQAEAIVQRVLTSRRCLAFFRANCTSGAANPLQEAFDRANVYIRLVDDTATGEQIGDDISFNLRAFRIGRWRIANALLHETFHVCDPVFDARDEIDAETAVEQCRVFTPFISTLRPRSGPVGTRVTIEGIGFGPSQGPADQVLFNGVNAGRAVSWGLVGTPGSSLARIVCEVPAGATTGDLVVVNNTVHSNALRFEVTP